MGFVQIRFGERVEKEGFMEMPMNVQFEGAYHELLYFLDYLQVYERAVRIDELRVDEADDTMMVSVRASTFYSAE
jgi:Tfp pilus assembly protein PilO